MPIQFKTAARLTLAISSFTTNVCSRTFYKREVTRVNGRIW